MGTVPVNFPPGERVAGLYIYSFKFETSPIVYFSLQIPILAFLFFVLFLGNTLTTSLVIPQKIKDKVKLKYRFTRLDKYFSTYTKGGRKYTLSGNFFFE